MAVACAARCATGLTGRYVPSLRVTAFNAAKAAGTMWLQLPAPPKRSTSRAIRCNGMPPHRRLNAGFAGAAAAICSGGARGLTAPRFGLARLTGQQVCTLRSKCLPALRAITMVCRTHRLYLTNCDYSRTHPYDLAAMRGVTTPQNCLMPGEVHERKQRHARGA